MSGEGVNGLQGVRDRLGQVEARVERLDERSQAHGRQNDRIERAVERIDEKLDTAISDLHAGAAVSAQKRTSLGGLATITSILIAAVGVIAAIVTAVVK